jgi:hypothetical protein
MFVIYEKRKTCSNFKYKNLCCFGPGRLSKQSKETPNDVPGGVFSGTELAGSSV